MILDELIAFLFGFLIDLPVLLFNLGAVTLEFTVGLFIPSFNIERKEKRSSRKKSTLIKKKRPKTRLERALQVIVIIALLFALFYAFWGHRKITFVAEDGRSVPKVEVLIETSFGNERKRTNLVGAVQIPRFTTQRLTIQSSRFLSKSWTREEIKPELTVERTVLGSSLDKAAGFLLKKALGKD